MLKAILGDQAPRSAAIMEQIWQFRHEQFVERLGWEDIRRADGREIDEFDRERAIHLPLMDQGLVVGYSRLLPTNVPHLLSDVYPELMEGRPWPRGERVYEWTRCIAAEWAPAIEGVAASNMLMTAVVEYCLVAGISSLIVETHPKLVNLLLTTGWDVTPLAAPTVFKGSLLLPIEAKPSAKTLFTHHEAYNINGSVLTIDGGTISPFDRDMLLGRLPYLPEPHFEDDAVADVKTKKLRV